MNKLSYWSDKVNRLGITYWTGKNFKNYYFKILENNLKYFDQLFIVTDEPKLFKNYKVDIIKMSNNELIDTFVNFDNSSGFDFRNKLNELTPGSLSDIPFYIGRYLVSKYLNKEIGPVIYFDFNTVIWNQWLIDDLSYRCTENKLYIKYSPGYYAYNDFKPYLSGDFGVDFKTKKDTEILVTKISKYSSRIKNKYTILGPSFLNEVTNNISSLVQPLEIISNELDPQLLVRGTQKVSHISRSIGFSLSESLINKANLKLDDLLINDDKTMYLKFI